MFSFSLYYTGSFVFDSLVGLLCELLLENILKSRLPSGSRQTRANGKIIVAHGRSGSSFTENIFNHRDPYQTVERLRGAVVPSNRDCQDSGLEKGRSRKRRPKT